MGNRAAARLLQRVSVADLAELEIPDALLELTVWDQFVELSRSQADVFAPSTPWRELALTYAKEHPDDGRWIWAGDRRRPRFHTGGPLVAMAGAETHAITLDRDVFFNPATRGEPHIDTYVHELVHVAQYGNLGVAGFLGTYLGEFLKHFVEGKLSGKDTDPYHAIVHEVSAKAIEDRFSAWRTKKEKKEKDEAAKQPKPRAPLEGAEEVRREAEEARRRGASPRTAGHIAIRASVGASGENRPEDVRLVAQRLHALGFLASVTTNVEAVTDAIEMYQLRVLKWRSADARVDLGGKTHAALNAGRQMSMELPERHLRRPWLSHSDTLNGRGHARPPTEAAITTTASPKEARTWRPGGTPAKYTDVQLSVWSAIRQPFSGFQSRRGGCTCAQFVPGSFPATALRRRPGRPVQDQPKKAALVGRLAFASMMSRSTAPARGARPPDGATARA